MIATIFNVLIYKLQTDPTLLSYLGGPYVFRAKRLAPTQIPSITVHETSERRKLRTGFNSIKEDIPNTILTFCTSTIEISVWVSSMHTGFPQTGADTDLISSRISELLLDSTSYVTGTHGWQQISHTQMPEDEKNLWHNVLRFSFDYHIDTTGTVIRIIDAGSPTVSGVDEYDGSTP
jgi:hypothetical protein